MRGGCYDNCDDCGAWKLLRAGVCKRCYRERDRDE